MAFSGSQWFSSVHCPANCGVVFLTTPCEAVLFCSYHSAVFVDIQVCLLMLNTSEDLINLGVNGDISFGVVGCIQDLFPCIQAWAALCTFLLPPKNMPLAQFADPWKKLQLKDDQGRPKVGSARPEAFSFIYHCAVWCHFISMLPVPIYRNSLLAFIGPSLVNCTDQVN